MYRSGDILFKLASLCFLAGIMSYVANNYEEMSPLLRIVDISAIVCVAGLIVYRVIHPKGLHKAILGLAALITANLCVWMVVEAAYPQPHSMHLILLLAVLCMIPGILSWLAHSNYFPIAISTAALLSFSTATLMMGNSIMYQSLPAIAGMFIGIPSLRNYFYKKERSTLYPQDDDEKIEHLMRLDPEDWHLMRQKKLDYETTRRIVEGMGRRIENKIINEAKLLIYTEEEIIGALSKYNPALTSAELQICYHVFLGRTVSEISELRNVSISTITSIRCRLRKKLGLGKDDILQSRLRTIVHDSCSSAGRTNRLWKSLRIGGTLP